MHPLMMNPLGKQVFTIRSKVWEEIGLAHTYYFHLLQESPDGAISYPNTGQTIMALAVTLPPTGVLQHL